MHAQRPHSRAPRLSRRAFTGIATTTAAAIVSQPASARARLFGN